MSDAEDPPTLSRIELLVVGLFVAAVTVGAVRAMQSGWVPIADEALMELRIRDVGGHLPLVGVYSRFGWNHPGPAWFLLLAVPYRILGSVSAALIVGALLWHLSCVLGAWWFARRIDRLAGYLALVGMLAVLFFMDPELLRTPWNPYVALVGSGALVIVAWAAAQRVQSAWVVLLPLGSLLVQAHVGNAPLVVVTAVAAALLMFLGGDSDGRQVPWRWIAVGLGAAMLLWLPPLVEQFSGHPGNFSRIVSGLSEPGDRAGPVSAISFVSRSFKWLPDWADPRTSDQELVSTYAVLPVWLIVPLAGLVLSVRQRNRKFVNGLIIVGSAQIAMLAAVSLIKDGLFNYLVVANRSISAMLVAVGLAALGSELSDNGRRRAGIAALAIAALLAAGLGIRQWDAENPHAGHAPVIREFAQGVERAVGKSPVRISSTLNFRSAEVADGLLLQLERRGIPAFVDPGSDGSGARSVGSTRVGGPGGAIEIHVAPVDNEADLRAAGWKILDVNEPISDHDLRAASDLLEERNELTAEMRARAHVSRADREKWRSAYMALSARIADIERGRVPMLLAMRKPTP